ncbi:MAG: MarR family winged helix-turn-helix transcriptional regulator [Thermodesulfobacteriota bacterium]|nr:MarR family winged helix-turn-helix transcriptional regulator [Thermodesulfobacteriota bacterium]
MEGKNQHLSTAKVYPSSHEQIREVVYMIRKLMQAGYIYTKELIKNYQVSAPQLNCLLALYEKGSLPPSQIARHIMVKSSTVTGVIDRLEYKGLVKRTRNSPDRRIINIEITETGKTLAQNAPPPIQQKIVDGLKRLPPSKLEEVIHNLGLITNMLDVSDLEAEHSEDILHPL